MLYILYNGSKNTEVEKLDKMKLHKEGKCSSLLHLDIPSRSIEPCWLLHPLTRFNLSCCWC